MEQKTRESLIAFAKGKPDHIGIYIGEGKCIEASGVDRGVIETEVKKSKWQYAVQLCDIDYSTAIAPPVVPVIKNAWILEDGGWRFYKTPDSYMSNEWMNYEGSRYWFDGDGHAISEKWYYFGIDCRMVTGLEQIDSHFYYFEKDGSMLPAGKTLILTADENGALTPGRCNWLSNLFSIFRR